MDAPSVLKADSVVTISYQNYVLSSSKTAGADGIIPMTVTPVVGIDVKATTTTAYSKIGGGNGSSTEDFDKTSLTVTAYYDVEKTITRVLSADEYSAKYDSTAASTGTTADKTLTVATTFAATNKTNTSVLLLLKDDTVVDFTVNTPEGKNFFVGNTKQISCFEFEAVWASGEESVDTYTFSTDLLSWDTTIVTGTFAASDVGRTWSFPVYLKADEDVMHTAQLVVSNSYKDGSATATGKVTEVKKGDKITAALLTVTADTQTSEDYPVPSGDIEFKIGNGEWVTEFQVPHYTTETSYPVTVRISMNNQTTPVEISTPVTFNVAKDEA